MKNSFLFLQLFLRPYDREALLGTRKTSFFPSAARHEVNFISFSNSIQNIRCNKIELLAASPLSAYMITTKLLFSPYPNDTFKLNGIFCIVHFVYSIVFKTVRSFFDTICELLSFSIFYINFLFKLMLPGIIYNIIMLVGLITYMVLFIHLL